MCLLLPKRGFLPDPHRAILAFDGCQQSLFAVPLSGVWIACSDGVRRYGGLEEYRRMGDVSVVGCVGSLIVATRGGAGPGEVLLSVRGSKEAYLAWSDQPLPRGTEVLVIDIRGARTVLVEPWSGLDYLTQIP